MGCGDFGPPPPPGKSGWGQHDLVIRRSTDNGHSWGQLMTLLDAVDAVEVWRGWYTPDGVDSEVVRRLARQDLDTTVAEDIRLVESVQRGLASRGYRPGPLVVDPRGGVNSEHALATQHAWYRDLMDA